MKYAKFINENQIEIAPKNYQGFFNFNSHVPKMLEYGFLPVEPAEFQESMVLTYQLADESIKEVYREFSTTELAEYKTIKGYVLWQNYKKYQTRFVDAEDLILATTLSLAGKPKGTAVRQWVQALWGAYYVEKDKLEAATKAAEFTIVNFEADYFGEPPFTIRELNIEAMEVGA